MTSSAVAGPAVVVAADAASYAVSVLALSLLRVPGGNSSVRRSLLRDMAEGWAEFRSRTWLWVVFGVGAVYGLLSSAAVLALRSVRAVTWEEKGDPGPAAMAFSPPRGGRRKRPAGPPR